jgi:hypothetical protein
MRGGVGGNGGQLSLTQATDTDKSMATRRATNENGDNKDAIPGIP